MGNGGSAFVELQKNAFNPGDIVSGTLYVNAEKPINVNSVKMKKAKGG
jgi:hypothetical protein